MDLGFFGLGKEPGYIVSGLFVATSNPTGTKKDDHGDVSFCSNRDSLARRRRYYQHSVPA